MIRINRMMLYRVRYVSALWSFKIIQGHRNWYQSKARMQLPIKNFKIVTICHILCRFRDITIYWSKIGVLSPFVPISDSFKALAMGSPGTYITRQLVSKS